MDNLLTVSFVGASLVPAVLLSGMVAISRRNVKKHQFRMLTGFVLFTVSLLIFWSHFYGNATPYEGNFPEAFGLLFWIHLGLGVAGVVLGGLTLWSVAENVWELHRRTGMFTVFSASVSSVLALIMILMIWIA